MALDGIIFGGMFSEEDKRPQDTDGITYDSAHRSAGSHRIASFLRQNGLDIEVVDFAPSWEFKEFQELIRSRMTPRMKFVGLGAVFNMNTITLVRCFTWLKQTYPDVILVTGAQDFYNLHFIPADYMVVGYGELAILEILKGTVKSTEEIIDKEGNTRRTVHALHDYPAYPMRNLSIDYEKRDFLRSFETVNMETSRGCRFKCSFCTYPILGVKDDHTRCTQDFHDNLMRNYENFGIQRYSITDETFNDYSEKIIKYADVVENLPFKPNFGGYIRADLLHTRPQDIEHLARMQFNMHFYGVESFHRPSAAAIGKGMDPTKIQQAILDTKDYLMKHNGFYKGGIGFIVGLPHETEETLNETKKWCDEHWKAQHVPFGVLRIDSDHANVKRSKLSTTYEKQGYSLIDPSDTYMNKDDPDLIRLYQSNSITPELKRYVKLNVKHRHKPTVLLHHWKSNTGMTEKDAQMWIVRNVWSKDNFLDFGPDFWQFNEWYIAGKTDQELLGSYRDLGSIRPDIQTRVDFIENYKKQKLDLITA
mgnify:CR=1 FL=1|jgi:radical SAM superfamily enzyme YgiQ (UPF0313 family)